VVISYGYFLLGFALWRRGPEVPEVTKLVLLLNLLIAILGVAIIRKELGIWLLISSLSISTIYVVLDPLVRIAWIQLSVLVAIIALAVTFAHRERSMWLTPALLFPLPILNFLAYYFEATSLLRSGSFLARGLISSLMILTTSAYALYGWNRMLKQATVNDERMRELVSGIETLEKAQASQRHWRQLVIRVHETTLNTIRSLLSMRDIDVQLLRPAIEKGLSQDRLLMAQARGRRPASVISSIRAGIDSAALQGKVRIISQGVNLHVDSEIAEALEQVIREALRNAIEHANAKNIEILWRTKTENALKVGEREQGMIFVTITNDGSASDMSRAGGIGTTLVMEKTVRDLGGSFQITQKDENNGVGTIVRLNLPSVIKKLNGEEKEFPVFSAVSLGRYMALLTLFGPAMTGVFFFPILGIWWPGQVLSQLLGFSALVYLLIFTFFRSKRLDWWESAALAVVLLSVILTLDLEPLTCTGAQPFQWVINSVVYGLFLILLWGKWQVVLVAYPLFLYLVAPLHSLVPQDCNFIFNFPILNTLLSFLFVAVIFTVVYMTFEKVEKFQESRRNRSNSLVAEMELSEASFGRILELDSLAQAAIVELASKNGPISMETQNTLRRIESSLRAEMQVDPGSSSGLTLLAVEFVNQVVANNHWINVKSIQGDEGMQTIPELVRERFLAIAPDLPSGASIQIAATESGCELSIHSRSQMPDSVRSFEKCVQSINLPGLTCSVNALSAREFVLFLRRERQSQQM
jgi:anti-sigma regulatory factor (Ser/Thr protein kinase)